jgi:hypothetical protein
METPFKRKFIVPIGDISAKKAKKRLRELREICKLTPELDKDYFIPIKNENQMNANYMHVVPNSHFWGDLNGLLHCLDYYYDYEKRKNLPKEPNVYYGESEMSKEYLLIGLNNAKKHGYKIKRFIEPEGGFIAPRFISIDQMIEWIQTRNFETIQDYQTFEDYIRNTLANGLNLTDGLKMERSDVYKRIDGERDYQDATWSIRREVQGTPDEEKPVAEWINYMEYHISKAKERVYHLDTEGALAEVRKVAALAVRTIEIHGCPERIIKNDCSDGKNDEKGDSNQPDGCCGIYKEEK